MSIKNVTVQIKFMKFPRSEYSIGLGKLLSAIRASTNGDTIGGPLAAFVLLGNEIFAMSHQTAVLPLTQAIAYLEKETIYANITRYGEVKATIYDYVFRSEQNPKIDKTNFCLLFDGNCCTANIAS